MALLFMDGFDAGDYASKYAFSGTPSVGAGRFGGSGLTLGSVNYGVKKAIAPSAQLFCGFALTTSQTSAVATNASTVLMLWGDNGTIEHLRVGSGGGQVWLGRAGTTLVTVANPYGETANNWQYWEVSATVADSGGTCVIRINGTEVINFTGDTRNAGTSTNIDAVQLWRGTSTTQTTFDDVYICDATGTTNNTFLGDVRVQTLTPSAAGSSTQWAPTGSASNWDNVNELPVSTTDYNSSATSGQRDLYALTDLLAGTAQVLGVQNNVVARKTDAGARSVRTVSKSGATVATGTAVTLGAADTTVSTLRTTDPATSAAWTVSGVNALEAGVEVV